jgi:hypothetical protein
VHKGEGEGEVELTAAQWREVRFGQGRGKAVASQPRRRAALGITGRVASVRLGEGDCRREGRLHGRGSVGVYRAGLLAACCR